ncbi:hypothetical protein FAIPA1_100006 [Frankia sp. AiPs1]
MSPAAGAETHEKQPNLSLEAGSWKLGGPEGGRTGGPGRDPGRALWGAAGPAATDRRCWR